MKMEIPLTTNDIQNAMVFLNRVDLKGNESMAHAELTMKLQSIGQSLQQAAQQANEPAPAAEVPIDEPLPEEGKAEK